MDLPELTPGAICLQGGGEFSAGCREMDAALLELTPGPVRVIALAAAPGREYAMAHAHGVKHFRGLGAEVVDVDDPREHGLPGGLDGVGLVVLPGGSPTRLLRDLRSTGIDDQLRAHVAAGGGVMGASAGAMVLCDWTVLPEGGPRLAEGLGLVAGLVVVPHWRGPRQDWLAVVGDRRAIGLPEESGVLVRGGRITAMGRSGIKLVHPDADLGVGDTLVLR